MSEPSVDPLPKRPMVRPSTMFCAYPRPLTDQKYNSRIRGRTQYFQHLLPDPGTTSLISMDTKGAPVVSVRAPLYLIWAQRQSVYAARGDYEPKKGETVVQSTEAVVAQEKKGTLKHGTHEFEMPTHPEIKIQTAAVSHVEIDGLLVVVKKYLHVPAHLLLRFPLLGSSRGIVGNLDTEKRLFLGHYQLIRLMKAASKIEPVDHSRFATLIYSQWNYPTWTADQLLLFVDFIFDSGAPVGLILDLCRPRGFALYGCTERTTRDWMHTWLAAALFRNRYVWRAQHDKSKELFNEKVLKSSSDL